MQTNLTGRNANDQILTAISELTGKRKDPMLSVIDKYYYQLFGVNDTYTAVYTTCADLYSTIKRMRARARHNIRINKITLAIETAEALYSYRLSDKERASLIDFINNDVIDYFIVKSAKLLIKKLSTGLISFRKDI